MTTNERSRPVDTSRPINRGPGRQAVDAAPPLSFPEEPLPADLKPVGAESSERPAERSAIEIRTSVEHRGRVFTIVATGYTLDQLCDMLDRRGFAPPAQSQQWQTLPDGTPICPKHKTPMKLREKQGDQWYSHCVGKDAGGREIYCKGYHGKDSPGYDL